jgi:hypothetical protein
MRTTDIVFSNMADNMAIYTLVLLFSCPVLYVLGDTTLLKRVNSRIHLVEQRVMFEIQELRTDLENEAEIREEITTRLDASLRHSAQQLATHPEGSLGTADQGTHHHHHHQQQQQKQQQQELVSTLLDKERASRNKSQVAMQRFEKHMMSSLTHIRRAVSGEKTARKRNARDITSLTDNVSTVQSCMTRELSATERVGSLMEQYIKDTKDYREKTSQSVERLQTTFETWRQPPNEGIHTHVRELYMCVSVCVCVCVRVCESVSVCV